MNQALGMAVQLMACSCDHAPLMGGKGLVGLADTVPRHPGEVGTDRFDAPPVVERETGQFLSALGGGDEGAVRHLVGDRLVPRMTDARPHGPQLIRRWRGPPAPGRSRRGQPWT